MQPPDKITVGGGLSAFEKGTVTAPSAPESASVGHRFTSGYRMAFILSALTVLALVACLAAGGALYLFVQAVRAVSMITGINQFLSGVAMALLIIALSGFLFGFAFPANRSQIE